MRLNFLAQMLAISSSNHGETALGSYIRFIDLLAQSCLSVPFSQFTKTISKGDWRAALLQRFIRQKFRSM